MTLPSGYLKKMDDYAKYYELELIRRKHSKWRKLVRSCSDRLRRLLPKK